MSILCTECIIACTCTMHCTCVGHLTRCPLVCMLICITFVCLGYGLVGYFTVLFSAFLKLVCCNMYFSILSLHIVHTCTCTCIIYYIFSTYCTVHIHVLMRDERRKKERSKQRQTNKQGKATQHTQGSFFLEKMRLRWDSNPRHSIHRTERSTS